MASYSPKYFQPVMWVAEYADGTLLREWEDSGKEHPFYEIDRSKLRKFHLVSKEFDYYFDCKTGVFVVNGIQFIFPLAGLELNYADGLIHYKDACTEFVSAHRKTHEYDGFEIMGFNVGWKVTYNNVKSQVIFNLPEKKFNLEITFLDIQKTVGWAVKV